MPNQRSSGWRRASKTRRLLVIERSNGTIEEKGFVTILGLTREGEDGTELAVEWRDDQGVFHTGIIAPGASRDQNPLPIALESGGAEIWHFDEEALAKR